jgi:putative transposase
MPWTKPYRPSRNQRLAPELYTSASRVYFITVRAYRKRSAFTVGALNGCMIDTLCTEQPRLRCRVFTYCLMPDHLHLLVSPCEDGVSILTFVDQYKGKTTRLSWGFGCQGKLWQPRYYDHIVRDDEDLLLIGEYVLDNPVRKGLVERAEDWPWSGQMNPLPG